MRDATIPVAGGQFLWRTLVPSKSLLIQCFALLILAGAYGSMFSDWAVTLAVPQKHFQLDEVSTVLRDPSRQMTINDILSPEGQRRFEHEASAYHSIGSTHDLVWIRIDLARISLPDQHAWYLEYSRAAMDLAELYLVTTDHSGKASIAKMDSDLGVPLYERQVQHVNSVYPVTLDSNRLPVAYLHLGNVNPIYGNINLWDPNLFLKKVAVEENLIGIFIGGMSALFLYNLCMYFSMRQVVYLYYLGYLAGVSTGYIFSEGHVNALFEADTAYYLKRLIPHTFWLVFISSFLFAREFMEIPRYHPRIDPFIRLVPAGIGIFWLVTPLIEFSIADRAGLIISLILVPMLFTVGLYSVSKGNRNAGFFMLAWVFNLSSGGLYIIMNLGLIDMTPFTRTAFPVGILIEALLLSFSLADKIKRVQEEAEVARARALNVAHEYGRELERKVDERTRHLTQTQQQLVSQQKMATLGALTQGVAHEINVPNQQIALNLESIALWKNDFLHMIDDLLGDDTDPEIRAMFSERFRRFNEQVEVVTHGSERMTTIIRGLQTMSRLDERARKPENVVDGLLQTVDLIKPSVGDDIEFALEIRDRPVLQCWAAALNNAFMGILDNAVLAIRERQKTAPDTYEGRIRVTSRMIRGLRGQELFLTIEDNGCGMSTENAGRAFDPFFTTRAVGSGAGLGLSTTRETIEKHGGKISLSSVPGEGTSVLIILPVTP